MTRLVLFDIDGTLVLTGGAGIRAMNRAGRAVAGVDDLLDGIAVAGRTDRIILHDALRAIGRESRDELVWELRDAYLAYLREEILQPGQGTKGVLPGVPELLAGLGACGDVMVGLLTGNFQEGARIKLEHFDLWRHFRCGAFGEDAADRNELVPVAVERARAYGLAERPYADVVVIGDTPHDVACARAVGARPVAVATGTCSIAELEATGAPVVLPDLGDTDAVLRLLRGA